MANAFGANPNASLATMLTTGAAKANEAIGASLSGVNSVLAGESQINKSISNMETMAGNIVNQAGLVNQAANNAQKSYDALTSIANLLGVNGSDLTAEGKYLSSQAKNYFNQGNALLNLDGSAGGLVGKYIENFNALSPDRLVSQATSDTQSSFANAGGQVERDLARRGVSASSGAYGALKKQYATSLATALAAAKTKARQNGLELQSAQLEKMINAANSLAAEANQTESNAINAQNAGASITKSSGDILDAQGTGYARVGALYQNAGQLFGNAADIYGNAGTLKNQYLQLTNTAYQNLASATQAAADYYLNAASREISANNGGGGGGSVSSSNASQSDDWMNWMGTGHTQSWNQNHQDQDIYNQLLMMAAAKS